MKYNLTRKDFQTAFEFAVKYHLDPTKSGTTRTAGSARSLGDVLDSFLLGKLAEIGVVNILQSLNSRKQCVLDFDLKPIYEVKNEPDIIGVIENNLSRKPNLFTEIKNTGRGDHWLGLTLEQYETINKSKTFDKFADAYKTFIKIEYAISGAELEGNGTVFKKNGLFYNTDLFVDIGKFFKSALEAGKFKDLGVQNGGEL